MSEPMIAYSPGQCCSDYCIPELGMHDEHEETVNIAIAYVTARVIAAEQAGREDNALHEMCYVSGSKALEAREAAVRREALLEAPKVEITHHLDGPATCRVEKDGQVLFVGRDWSDAVLAEPERDEVPCSCGSRDATSLTPGEWLHHSPDGCTIERGGEGGR